MRITHSMITSRYIRDLNRSLNNLNDATSTSTDYRKFRKVSEDPFSAAKAFRLRREYQQNDDYQSSLNDVSSQIETAQGSMMSINSIIKEVGSGDCLQAINGSVSDSDRDIIASKLEKVQDSIISLLNTKFADKYVFGGAETDNPPFSVDDSGELLFRGINVNTGEIAAGTTAFLNGTSIQFGSETGTKYNGYTISVQEGGSGAKTAVAIDETAKTIAVTMDLTGKSNQDLLDALQTEIGTVSMSGDLTAPLTTGTSEAAVDTVGQEGLQKLANEKALVDLGLGLRFNSDGTINTQSVFNSAIPGLSFMGYGETDGIPNNLYSQLNYIIKQLKSDSFSADAVQPYMEAFSKQGDALLAEITKSGTASTFLETKLSQLEKQSDSISEKDMEVEYVDPVEAIMDYKMQEYSYRAALQMGVKILQPTFLDFMQ